MPGIFHTVTPEEIAQWPKPNYNDPLERTWLAPYAIAWEVVSTALVLGRLYLRKQGRSGSLGSDDVAIVIAWVFSIAFTTTACLSVWRYHIGRHVWDVLPVDYSPALYAAWLAQVMFIFSTGSTKMSVLLFYCRLLKDTYSKIWLHVVWILIFLTLGSWLAAFIAYCLMCRPLSIFWNIYNYLFSTPPPYKCIDGDDLTIAVGVMTIASDFWTAALPCTLFQYYDLGVSKRQKLAMNLIFCLGFFVTGVGGVRTYYLWQMRHTHDLSWLGYDLFATSVVECQLAIICSCAPFCRAFFRRYLPDIIPRSRSRISTVGHSIGSAGNRISVRLGGVRTSFVNMTSPPQSPTVEDMEKTGCLVRDETNGRLIWSSKGPRVSDPPTASPWKDPRLPDSPEFPLELPTPRQVEAAESIKSQSSWRGPRVSETPSTGSHIISPAPSQADAKEPLEYT